MKVGKKLDLWGKFIKQVIELFRGEELSNILKGIYQKEKDIIKIIDNLDRDDQFEMFINIDNLNVNKAYGISSYQFIRKAIFSELERIVKERRM